MEQQSLTTAALVLKDEFGLIVHELCQAVYGSIAGFIQSQPAIAASVCDRKCIWPQYTEARWWFRSGITMVLKCQLSWTCAPSPPFIIGNFHSSALDWKYAHVLFSRFPRNNIIIPSETFAMALGNSTVARDDWATITRKTIPLKSCVFQCCSILQH